MQENSSIEQLENDYWKDVDFPTGLVERCFAYRQIPISKLSAEQLRLLIGQKIGLPYTIPKTISLLEKDILAEGDTIPATYLIRCLTFLTRIGSKAQTKNTNSLNCFDRTRQQ